MSLEGQIVLVTGGAGLLGKAFCDAIVEAGGVAIVADRNLAGAESVADSINGRHAGRARPAHIDITDVVSVNTLLNALETDGLAITAVVNNAYPRNAAYGRQLEDVTYADFSENLSIHLGGYFLVAQQCAARLRRRGGGAIINMGSIYGVMAPRFSVYEGTKMTMPVEYAAIKASVIHLTRYFAQYFKGTGIRVNAISPGGIENGQPEAFLERYRGHCASKGMLGTEDVIGALVFLLSDGASAITGQNFVVDDGFSL